MENRYLTIKETAQLANTTYPIVKRAVANSKLPAYKVGRKYFIAADDAEAYSINRRKMAACQGYTIKELMEILPLSYAFIIDEIKKGSLQACKCGRRFIIPKDELKRYLEKAKIKCVKTGRK